MAEKMAAKFPECRGRFLKYISQCGHCESMNLRTWHLTYKIFLILHPIIFFLQQLTSFLVTSNIISFIVDNKMFRSGFLGSVVQLTDALGNNIIETMTSMFIVACLKTLD